MSTSSMNAEVFISYASDDRLRILDLVERLRRAGVSVWIDQMGIEGATMWSQEIVEAIDGCKVLILAISQRSTESENVVKELALASERRKKILPVCLDSSGIPKSMEYQLAGIQRVEYVEGEEEQGLLAMMYFDLGKIDFANTWLEKAIKNRESALWGVAADDEYAEWQKHPKFIELMKSVNHPLYVDK